MFVTKLNSSRDPVISIVTKTKFIINKQPATNMYTCTHYSKQRQVTLENPTLIVDIKINITFSEHFRLYTRKK